MTAAVFDQPIALVQVAEGTALGAALLGGVAAGVYPDIAAGAAALRYDEVVVEPDVQLSAFYQRGYTTVYRQLYDWLRPLNHATFDLLNDGSTE